MGDDRLNIQTVCVQAREDLPSENRPLIAPIYQTAVWTMESAAQCEAVQSGEQTGYVYTRDANPNHTGLERVVARLERAEAAVVFASGMAALAAALTALTGSGGRVVAAHQVYGATFRLMSQEMARFGVEFAWVDVVDLNAVERALAPVNGRAADLLLVETLANPLLQLADLTLLSALCRRHGARLVVDNTFATPCCCRPLEHGADVVVHSLTKFLGGHSDLTLGVAAGSVALMEALRRQARLFGGAANPFESWLALRGIATFPLRMERSCANAAELAGRLEQDARVRRVYYPGLATYPQYERAREVLASPGAMLSFEVEDGRAARALLDNLRLVRFAPSLGDAATTVSYPVATSHRGLSLEIMGEIGISPGLLRLSVGIDHVEDVWTDLEQALGGGGRA